MWTHTHTQVNGQCPPGSLTELSSQPLLRNFHLLTTLTSRHFPSSSLHSKGSLPSLGISLSALSLCNIPMISRGLVSTLDNNDFHWRGLVIAQWSSPPHSHSSPNYKMVYECQYLEGKQYKKRKQIICNYATGDNSLLKKIGVFLSIFICDHVNMLLLYKHFCCCLFSLFTTIVFKLHIVKYDILSLQV